MLDFMTDGEPCPYSNAVDQSLDALLYEFGHAPHMFLSEDDVRSIFYSILLENGVPRREKTADGHDSRSIHTEVRWYGKRSVGTDPKDSYEVVGALHYRSDLVIIDPRDLLVSGDGINTKGFGFDRFWYVFEFKLRRMGVESNRSFNARVQSDVERMKDIRDVVQRFNDHRDFAKFVMVCLDKGGIERQPYTVDGDIHVYYRSMLA